ncbi:MAG: terminase small subunit [Desulfuromonadaceae bacterium]
MAGKLTGKQKMFVTEYLVDLNATAAAIRAGYSQKRASELGYQLLHKTTVQSAIQEAMRCREKRTEITQDKVIQQLAKIAFSDMNSFVSYGPEEVDVGEDEEGNTVKRIYSAVKVKPSDQVDGTLLAEVSETKEGIKIKRHDSLKALELLGKHLGMFVEKHEHNGSINVIFNVPRPPKVESEEEDNGPSSDD